MRKLACIALGVMFIVISGASGFCDVEEFPRSFRLEDYKVRVGTYTYDAKKFTNGVWAGGTLAISAWSVPEGILLDWLETYGDGQNFLHLLYRYAITDKGSVEAGYASLNPSGAIVFDAVYEDPLVTFPFGQTSIGALWGGAFIEKRQGILNPLYQASFARTYTYAVLGIEDVTVPAGRFERCLKIARLRGNQADRIGWFAKGIGPVKFIYAQEEHSFTLPGQPPVNLVGYSRLFALSSFVE